MPNSDAALREVLDRAAIRDVLLRYARGVDRRDFDLVAACFTADAAYAGALGTGTIATALAALPPRLRRYARTMHFMGNQLIEITGDSACSETYAIAYHQLIGDDTRKVHAVGIRYLDELVRRDGAWRICRRQVHRDLQWEVAAVDESLRKG